ncbi:hypothetical protein E4A48_09465 [Xanthomonas cerealis pv. cerealis]|uniref:Uncharacterized protein n=2 Tax=Xanthomonas translucens group TaxID=3390202 RepID=A0A514ECZ4_9XANT|nr:hypothetical protein E4A48_09465 [Xanthomonas translucens pv. cerealis]
MEADFFIFPRRLIMRTRIANQSSVAFVGASCVVLLLFGVFAAVSVRKRVRDRVDGIPMTAIRDGLGWFLWAGPARRPSRQDCPSSPKLRGRCRRRTVMPAAGFVC